MNIPGNQIISPRIALLFAVVIVTGASAGFIFTQRNSNPFQAQQPAEQNKTILTRAMIFTNTKAASP